MKANKLTLLLIAMLALCSCEKSCPTYQVNQITALFQDDVLVSSDTVEYKQIICDEDFELYEGYGCVLTGGKTIIQREYTFIH